MAILGGCVIRTLCCVFANFAECGIIQRLCVDSKFLN